MISFCKYCGKQIDPDSIFCPICGKIIDNQAKTILDTNHTENTAKGKINFFNAIKNLYINCFNFSGRATRSEYWYGFLYYRIWDFFFICADVPFGLQIFFSLLHTIPWIALTVRRLHDTGKSSVYYWLFLIPLFGLGIFVCILCKKSDDDNEWGPSPYQENQNDQENRNDNEWLCDCGKWTSKIECTNCGNTKASIEETAQGNSTRCPRCNGKIHLPEKCEKAICPWCYEEVNVE